MKKKRNDMRKKKREQSRKEEEGEEEVGQRTGKRKRRQSKRDVMDIDVHEPPLQEVLLLSVQRKKKWCDVRGLEYEEGDGRQELDQIIQSFYDYNSLNG